MGSRTASSPVRWSIFAILLLLAGYFGFQGATVAPPSEKAAGLTAAAPGVHTTDIEQVEVGQRVLGRNLELSEADRAALPPEPDPATWRKLRLRMVKTSDRDKELLITLLRPLEWIESVGAISGGTIHLDLSELGAEGPAEVLAIEPCPPIAGGNGNVVTGTFAHEPDDTTRFVYVYIEGQAAPIHCTDNHPFWSEDRKTYVPVRELRSGERVRTRAFGDRGITAITDAPRVPLVYNLEIQAEHVYEVGRAGVIVHNSKALGHTPRYRWYHGTDAASAADILENGLSKEKLIASKPVEAEATPGLYVTDRLDWARDYAARRQAERIGAGEGVVLGFDDEDVAHLLGPPSPPTKNNEAVLPFDVFDKIKREIIHPIQ